VLDTAPAKRQDPAVDARPQVGGRDLSAELLAELERAVREEPGLSRSELARRVCHELDWTDPAGQPKEVSCRIALLNLSRRGLLELPPGRGAIPAPKEIVGFGEEEREDIDCSLAELGELRAVVVTSGDGPRNDLWKRLMTHHYLRSARLAGAQIRYLVESDRGCVAALGFSAAAWRIETRDRFIGWSETARAANLRQVVSNSRFLIPPWVSVPELASKVLSLCARQLLSDWSERYGYGPVLLETFVDSERFRGTCYRAAGWHHVGATKGRGRQDQDREHGKTVKEVFVLPIDKRWKAILRREPLRLPARRLEDPRDWAEEELGGAELGDERLSRRLVDLARAFYARPRSSIPRACDSRARTKAAYRLLMNENVNLKAILAPHHEATMRRITAEKVVLAVQDTTSFNYSSHPQTEGLGPIGSSLATGPQGILMHDTLAFTPAGVPLGLIDVEVWARDPEQHGKKRARHSRPIEQKESHRWLRSYQAVAAVQAVCPDTTLVSVGDREADIYDLFVMATSDPEGPRLLVRATQDRLVADGQERLWSHVQKQAAASIRVTPIPRSRKTPAREAALEIRFARVTLGPPKNRRSLPQVDVWAVLASEVDAPEGIEPLEWMLLTTLPANTVEEAIEKLDWYAKRWGVEIFHKVIKSGCRIEERQLAEARRLENCLAIDLVAAWRIFHLTMLGRQDPGQPCTAFFDDDEWKALIAFREGVDAIPAEPPTLREATRRVANLGGFLGRKGDGEPGVKSLWLGLERLDTVVFAWRAFGPDNRGSPGRSPPPVSSR
jgi:Druantia protein DruA/Transposase DNA-binding/Transposase Tn5 dimerisation domain